MSTVSLSEAKSNLSQLLRGVEAGEEVVITRRGKPPFPKAAIVSEILSKHDAATGGRRFNAITVACDLSKLLRRAASRTDENGAAAPMKIVFSSHHALFFNVMCNEIGRAKEGEPKVTHKRYFLHRPNGDGVFTLRATEDTPFFHHVASLAELQLAADPNAGRLYTFHFNALRSIMEKTASFFGHADISFCLKALGNEEDRALYNRTLNLLSHGKYAIHEPTEMGDDNKALFRRILEDFTTKFQFDLPDILAPAPVAAVSAPAPAPAPAP